MSGQMDHAHDKLCAMGPRGAGEGAIMIWEYASKPRRVGVMGKGWHPCTLPQRHKVVGGGDAAAAKRCSG